MLSKSEIKFLSKIRNISDHPMSIQEVADRLDWSEGHASRVISKLQERGFVRTNRRDGKKLVTIADIPPVERLGALMSEFEHVDFPELISGSALEILFYLNDSRTATELAELSRKNRNTVYRRLKSLQNVGIVGKEHSQYRLTEPFSSLVALARSIAHHDHRREARNLTDNVNIIWETHDEYLFNCDKEVPAHAFHQTGPSVFEEFGIPLFTRERLHYLRSKQLSGITAVDLVCHTLLIDDGTRYRSYCLLLIEGNAIESAALKERAEYYGAEAEIDLVTIAEDLVSYLETNGTSRDEMLPLWEDFKQTAADYDISV